MMTSNNSSLWTSHLHTTITIFPHQEGMSPPMVLEVSRSISIFLVYLAKSFLNFMPKVVIGSFIYVGGFSRTLNLTGSLTLFIEYLTEA